MLLVESEELIFSHLSPFLQIESDEIFRIVLKWTSWGLLKSRLCNWRDSAGVVLVLECVVFRDTFIYLKGSTRVIARRSVGDVSIVVEVGVSTLIAIVLKCKSIRKEKIRAYRVRSSIKMVNIAAYATTINLHHLERLQPTSSRSAFSLHSCFIHAQIATIRV